MNLARLALAPCLAGLLLWEAGAQTPAPNTAHRPDLASADAAFRQGSAAFARNDLPAAGAAFTRATRLAPRVAAGHAALGAVLFAQGKADAAVRELESAYRLDPSDQTSALNLALAEAATHDYKRSAATFLAIPRTSGPAAADSLPPDQALALATALSESANLAAADSLLVSAIQAAPDSAPLHDALGSILAREDADGRKRLPEAEAEFREALRLQPRLPSAHFHLGSVQLETDRPADAAAELAQAHALEPANASFTLQWARALLAEAHDEEAVALLRTLSARRLSETEATEAKYQLALALQASGSPREALPLFNEVVARRPDDPLALTNAALAHVQLGDAAGGIPLYLRALKLNPQSGTLREDLGVAFLQQSDLDHALEQFQAGLALDPQNPFLHYDLGLAWKLKDDLPRAIPELQQAGTLDPTLPDPPYTLGVLLMQQGRFAEAAASLEKVTVLQPHNGDAWATLGSVYRQLDQPGKALPALQQAIALLPAQPSPHITLAAILSAQGKKEEAAAERKIGADLTRVAVNRQKADFGLNSGAALLHRGQVADALVQLRDAVAADPGYAAAHLGLADALEKAGEKAEAARERQKAAALQPPPH